MTSNSRLYIFIFALMAVAAVSASGRLALLPQSCDPGHRTSDYCNSCVCIASGDAYECTTKECPQPDHTTYPKRQDDESCVLGTTKRVACYTCNCEGNPPKWSCPNVGCI